MSAIMAQAVRLLLFGLLFAVQAAFAVEQSTIGVLAFRDQAETAKKWQPLADYLERALPGMHFALKFGSYEELEAAIERRQVDFVLSNPAHYVTMRERNSLSYPLATLIEREGNLPLPVIGGAVVVRADRGDIATLADLKGKRVAVSDAKSFGGYRVQAYEMHKIGLSITGDVDLIKVGLPVDRAVTALLEGKADAAFARMGLIDDMAREGKLDLARVKVLDPRKLAGHGCKYSGTLYPTWPFVAMPQVPDSLASRVAAALLMLPHDGVVARAADIWGFSVPANYEPVEELARTLRLPPFDEVPEFSLSDVWRRYRATVVIVLAAVALILMLMFWLVVARRKALEASIYARRFKAIVDSTDDAIIGKTLDGVITSWNSGAQKMFGYTAAETIGQPVQMLVPPDRAHEVPEILARIVRGERVEHFETVRRHKDGRSIDIAATISPIVDAGGKIIGASKIARDITARKLVDAELAQHRYHLEKLVEERTAALSVAKEAAEAANRAKDGFLANMSHELRTPLNGVMGMTALAQRRATDPQQKDYLAKAARSAQHLAAIIDDILDIAKIEADHLRLVPVDFKLNGVLDDLTGQIGRNVQEKGLQWSVDIAPDLANIPLRGDAARLKQVLFNLASNAIKFTDRGSIAVRVSKAEDNANGVMARFEVRDTGIGIAAADQAHLFTAFRQVDGSMTRKYGGTGLGLAISKRLAEAMGGGIGVASRVGAGSTFWFTAVFAKGAAGVQGAKTPSPDSAEAVLRRDYRNKRLLVVEDDEDNRELTLAQLKPVWPKVDAAADGVEAVELVRKNAYDLILMDMRMPRMDGLEATRQIRALPHGAAVPILAMTANVFPEDRERCMEAGMNDFIAKAVSAEAPFATILKWLAQAAPVSVSSPQEIDEPHPAPAAVPASGDTPKATLLIVDDAPENLGVLAELLQPQYRVLAATSGEGGLRVANGQPRPDLILLDVMMPGMDGYTVLARLRENPPTRDIPVVFLTSLAGAEDEERGLQLGAADYIAKPIKPAAVLARVRTQLEAKQARDWLKDQNATLEAEVARRMSENDLIQQASIRALAHLAETRDPETGNHIRRTQGYVQRLALGLQQHRRFAATLSDRYIELLARSAPLHDVGKVGIPDHIRLKPGALTPAEWVVMRTHARLGSEAIAQAERDIETPLAFLVLAKEIAHSHHEKWDGSGYPDALAGEAIPISARLMAVADVFDALVTPRVYKAALTYEAARDIIAGERGKHFDPDVTDAFLSGFADFVEIARRYADDGEGAFGVSIS